MMKISFDPAKNARNIAERGLSFERAVDLDWVDAVIVEDERNPYPERRYVAVGYLEGRLHVLCFTPIPDGIRVISFRKANLRESRRYGKEITITPNR
ncbi:MAG: BrnT family toxin [Methylococcaceae bacterium]|nr:BrnT family toxin [Methylococcaceae bacterium]